MELVIWKCGHLVWRFSGTVLVKWGPWASWATIGVS